MGSSDKNYSRFTFILPSNDLKCNSYFENLAIIELPSNKQNFKSPNSVDNDSGIFEVVKEKLNKNTKPLLTTCSSFLIIK